MSYAPRYDVVASRKQKSRRRGTKFIIFLVVLAGLLVGADFAAAAFAEHTISQQAREKFQLQDDPAVHIRGFPFTTQALGGEYEHITVAAEGINVQDTLHELELMAELRNVTAPLSDVVDGNTSAIVIGDLEGIAKIRQADIGRLIKLPSLSIEPAAEDYVRTGDAEDFVSVEDLEKQREASNTYDSTAGVRLAATTRIAGREIEIVAFAIIELTESAVRIDPQRLEFGQEEETTVVPDQVRKTLLPQFGTTIEPGSLPFNVRPSGVAVEHGKLIVQGKAQNVTFAGSAQD
ncbi:MAG: DUF2993 domain-containing protein [Actinophytocola sp.]|nr:DUF2993 domain-containing protein [Actinophytocola sp.]